MYQIEYKVNSNPDWFKAGFELTEEQVLADYHRKAEDYNRGRRRAFLVERIPVSFETVTTIKLKK